MSKMSSKTAKLRQEDIPLATLVQFIDEIFALLLLEAVLLQATLYIASFVELVNAECLSRYQQVVREFVAGF